MKLVRHWILGLIRRAIGLHIILDRLDWQFRQFVQAGNTMQPGLAPHSSSWTANEKGPGFVVIPVDHQYVVNRNPPTYVYEKVENLFLSRLAQIKQNIELLLPKMYNDSMNSVPKEKEDEIEPYWNNGYFSGDDARIAYALTATLKPAKIVEIGSGNSTKFFRKAIREFGLATQLICIDPVPRAEITKVADRIHLVSCLDAPMELFEGLKTNDILFIDGSHLVLNGTDTTHIFLNILPVIKPGVMVHIHDIDLPGEYNQTFQEREYNEQYMLATLLLNSEAWTTYLPVKFALDQGLIKVGGKSFWMVKTR